jgi:predicted NBD/HSP70 family sugar kinase
VLGVAIGGVVTLLALECVVLGGGFVDALGDPYLDMVAKGVCKSVFPDECRNVKVVRSELGDDAGPVGAALLAGRRWGVAGS